MTSCELAVPLLWALVVGFILFALTKVVMIWIEPSQDDHTYDQGYEDGYQAGLADGEASGPGEE